MKRIEDYERILDQLHTDLTSQCSDLRSQLDSVYDQDPAAALQATEALTEVFRKLKTLKDRGEILRNGLEALRKMDELKEAVLKQVRELGPQYVAYRQARELLDGEGDQELQSLFTEADANFLLDYSELEGVPIGPFQQLEPEVFGDFLESPAPVVPAAMPHLEDPTVEATPAPVPEPEGGGQSAPVPELEVSLAAPPPAEEPFSLSDQFEVEAGPAPAPEPPPPQASATLEVPGENELAAIQDYAASQVPVIPEPEPFVEAPPPLAPPPPPAPSPPEEAVVPAAPEISELPPPAPPAPPPPPAPTMEPPVGDPWAQAKALSGDQATLPEPESAALPPPPSPPTLEDAQDAAALAALLDDPLDEEEGILEDPLPATPVPSEGSLLSFPPLEEAVRVEEDPHGLDPDPEDAMKDVFGDSIETNEDTMSLLSELDDDGLDDDLGVPIDSLGQAPAVAVASTSSGEVAGEAAASLLAELDDEEDDPFAGLDLDPDINSVVIDNNPLDDF
jgi:hypothetical protein